MLLVTQLGIAGHPCTPRQTARCVFKRVIQNEITVAIGLAGLVRTLLSTSKINMAPKTALNSGDKTDGSKIMHRGKDKGDSAGVGRRLTSIMAKLIGKNTTGLGRDAKTGDSTTPLLDVRGKNKGQPTITSFPAVGAQESCTGHIIPPPTNSQSVIEAVVEAAPLGTCSEKVLTETKEPLIKASQGDDGLPGVLDSSVVTKKKKSGFHISKNGLQAQRTETLTGGEAASDLYDTTATLSTEAVQYMPSKLMGGDKETERGLKPQDWAKDSGDKFYSLTEEYDLTSGEHSLSESGSSMSSETGNISSNEPTVWQLRRHRKCTKMRSGPSEGTELSTFSSNKTLKWDYSGIRLTDIPTANGQQMANNNMEGSIGGPTSSTCTVGADSGMLQSIYNSI
ncbi:hypothetical protein NDU88_007693 [Pleurodeles waltl]|uniref:Uncharacterized protein n=1 Tax=Pleurodeles waltl TaxID=8319 RepID=A0AAV7U1Z2_PLEWA|nr:hypothetical protein NDU88_007693 [Pleurodeles waltl]